MSAKYAPQGSSQIRKKAKNNNMTKEKFEAYVEVQMSGATNMFDIRKVIELSCGELTKEDCLDIMKNYTEYKKKFNLKQ